ncbi:MAG TPA: type II secretion system protein [Phycisphaerae bacterium]|nr:type II secretion system protein [Phycisphaerae bacterium]
MERYGIAWGRRGFTLIELLVVVSIIALLMAVLLPSLSASREAARKSVCGAHMRGAMLGVTTYMTEYNNWIPGPFTSGTMWNYKGPGNILTSPTDSVDATSNHGRSFPFQNEDWVSPTLGESMTLPDKDQDRAFAIYNSKLRCPSNFVLSNDFFSGSPPPNQNIYFPSYGAAVSWASWPAKEIGGFNPTIATTTGFSERLPADYVPRLDKIGNPSQKAFIVEGSRYVDVTQPSYASINFARYQIQGGGLMIGPPTEPFANTPWDMRPVTANPSITSAPLIGTFGARHRSGSSEVGMNLAFFDNHVEFRKGVDFTHVELYFPPLTRMLNSANTHFDPVSRTSAYIVP